jgi:glycosyltransferase 2 family protein
MRSNVSEPIQPAQAQAAAPPRRRGRAILFLILKLLATATVLVFVVKALGEGFASIPWSEVTFLPKYVILAVAAMMMSKLLSCTTYSVMLGEYGRKAGWRIMMAAAWLPPMGKYIPGKVASVAWAIMLLGARRIPAGVVAQTVFLQGALGVVVGLVVAVPLVILQPELFEKLASWLPGRFGAHSAWMWCVLLIVTGVIVLHPRVLFPIMDWAMRRLKRAPIESSVSIKMYLLAATTMVAQWICLGAASWCLARSIQADAVKLVSAADLPLFISATALANCVGFLVLFAPAGLGPREAILLPALSSVLANWAASIVVVSTRLMQVALEVVLAGIGYLLLRSAGPPPEPDDAPRRT